MSFNIVLNSSNVIGINNNQYQINFINGGFSVPEGSEMSLSQVTIPYSWYNISANLGNNIIQYSIPTTGTTLTTQTITIPDGFYGVNDLSIILQKSLFANNYYFYQNSTGSIGTTNPTIIYPISLSVDPINYTNQITFQYIPSANPVGTAVSSSVIASNVISWGSAQNLGFGLIYNITGTGIPAGTYAIGTGVSSTVTIINNSLTVSSETITWTLNVTASLYGAGYNWALGSNPTNCSIGNIIIPQANSKNITISSNGIGNILGFLNGTYPPAPIYLGGSITQTTNIPTLLNSQPYIVLGNTLKASTNNSVFAYPPFAPLGSSVNGVIMRCNLVDNTIVMPSDVIDSFPITSTFGSNINYLPVSDNWIKMKKGKHSSLTIQFCDQSFNPLICQDSNVLITLLVRFSDKLDARYILNKM